MEDKCKNIGNVNRFGVLKVFTCLDLPAQYIHKPVGEWMCTVCARNLLSGSEDF